MWVVSKAYAVSFLSKSTSLSTEIYTGFPTLLRNQTPWFFHDFPWLFHHFSMIDVQQQWLVFKLVNHFCVYWMWPPGTLLCSQISYPTIMDKGCNSYSSQNSVSILDEMHGAENFFPWFFHIDVLKFHDFSMILAFFFKFHDFSRSGKCLFHFPGFPWFSRPLGTLFVVLYWGRSSKLQTLKIQIDSQFFRDDQSRFWVGPWPWWLLPLIEWYCWTQQVCTANILLLSNPSHG